MPGYKGFTSATLASADVNDYLMKQAVMTFSTTAARDTALSGVLREGLFCYISGTDAVYYYNGSAWIPYTTQWTSMTPAWEGGTVTVGNGTVTAGYRYENGSIHLVGQFELGSTSSITGVPQMTLPFSITNTTFPSVGSGWIRDTSASGYFGFFPRAGIGGGNNVTFDRDTTPISSTSPMTWATGDLITWDIVVPGD